MQAALTALLVDFCTQSPYMALGLMAAGAAGFLRISANRGLAVFDEFLELLRRFLLILVRHYTDFQITARAERRRLVDPKSPHPSGSLVDNSS